MSYRAVLAAASSAAILSAQVASAGGIAPAVDCDVTPDAPQCATVVFAPEAAGGSGLSGLGTAGTAAAVVGGVAALALLAAALDDDDDDSSSTTTTE
ncbi:hypothetical protein [Palleronia rufa]|uniref:hypothetical protein n=1 Tax=Palleronia rufa TaxID=1530186 RepID=UPI00056667DA|nr:hypothetical protein [Palleronia rufa]